jgi:RHS repeat-associated protein
VDNFTLLGSSTISGFSLGTWYTLGLRANGNQISVEVNGNTVIGPVTDTAFTSGNAGVWSYAPTSAGSHRFDNPSTSLRTGFSITTLGGGVYRKVKVLAMADARPLAVVNPPPPNTTYRVYYYAAGKPIAMRVMPPNDATGTLYYLHADHLGSTSVTTCGSGACGAAGAVVARQWYEPFGKVRGSTGTLPTDITFTGQRSDATGLYFFQARYYSGTLGRFVSADSIVPGAGNPQAFNRYAYSLSNPLKYIDPTGHASIPSCAGKPDCGIKEDPPQPPPDPCKVLGLWCKPPTNPILQSDDYLEYEETTTVLQIGPSGMLMATSQNKGGGVRAKVAELLLRALPPGSAAADWVQRVLCGGDCSDEFKLGSEFNRGEVELIRRIAEKAGVKLDGITLWRGENSPPSYYGSGSPGNITFYDSFFRASLEKQISVLKEEFQHTLQLVVEYSDETVRMLEQIAKQQK